MRRHISKDKEIPISQKVKKMFRYSPSYQAQKCCSKLPLRYSYASSTTKIHSFRPDQIHCEYSSVKEKNLETNQCNDTSSWIAKLVSGIQDSDDQNKNLHKLSEIQNQSLNDLPEDSQDYPDNEFLSNKPYHLFNIKSGQNTPNQLNFSKEVLITNPIKKSVKQALIEIELNQIKQGIKVPPVTRVNSSKKQQENPQKTKPNSKYNSTDKSRHQQIVSLNEQTIKSPLKEKSQNKKLPSKPVRNSLISQKTKSQAKRKLKTVQKFVQKSIQVEELNATCNDNYPKSNGRTFESQSQSDQSLYVQTCKNSVRNSGTKKQSIARLKNEEKDIKTRKNSLISREQLSECKEQLNMVEEYSRNLNMKNLFSEENEVFEKPQNFEQTMRKTPDTNKRVGGIKKNVLGKQKAFETKKTQAKVFDQVPLVDPKQKIQETKDNEIQLKYSYISTKRQSKDITLNYRNSDPRILIEFDQTPLPSSSRRYTTIIPSKRIEPENNIETYKAYNNHLTAQTVQRRKSTSENQQLVDCQANQRIVQLFNKLKLYPSKDFIDRNNLKIRGLNQQQRAQLGSIITKIHYQDVSFDIDSFTKEFKRMNIECTQNGCLSQQKRHKTIQRSPTKQILPLNSVPKHKEEGPLKSIVTDNISFDRQDQNEVSYHQNIGFRHRRRESKLIKKKLFQQIKRFSYLQEITTNQPQKKSTISQKDNCKENSPMNKNLNNPAQRGNMNQKQNRSCQEQQISKSPYIEAPSLYQIQLSKRDFSADENSKRQRKHQLEQDLYKRLDYNNHAKGPSHSQLTGGNDTCLLQRLNKKLTSYIDKNHIENTFRQFNLNFSELKKHIR